MQYIKTPKQALNPAFLKQKPARPEIELFKKEFIALLDRINVKESEEFHKNLIKDFLNSVYYKDKHYINTRGKNDLVIHNGNNTLSPVGVLVETKSPANKTEMVSHDNLNVKSFQELILYYLRERKTEKNIELRHLIITNIYEWFVFDARDFEKLFYQNKALLDLFEQFQAGKLSGASTDFFYREIAAPEILKLRNEISYTYLDIRDYDRIIRDTDKEDDRRLIALYKFLSPVHLLKQPFANDNNQLNRGFYAELLHIIGLEEILRDNKKLIVRKNEKERDGGSIIENAIERIDAKNKLNNTTAEQYGKTKKEQLFGVAIDLAITWINRILFLKLFESQILKYHKGNRDYAFLSTDKLNDYNDLDMLFFSVLALRKDERNESVKSRFERVPYLNSSLFEITEIEDKTICIDSLQNNISLALYAGSVLRGGTSGRGNDRNDHPKMKPLEYLLKFLDAYDFSSEGSEDIQEENKPLISASVLGLIFEKINGYRDGSFFTPSFITMYMCRETITRAVIQKFNEVKNWNCLTITELYNKIENIEEANSIFNSLRICDPAVGSGHFLVSALNEMIRLKSELGILTDKSGRRLKDYRVTVENDELIVTDDEANHFTYNPENTESGRVQEAFFNEKQTIIENCLFGVDINPNSVKICQLRLWIELLKHAYYHSGTGELETLPNIDINIKCGNSLINRFDLRGNYATLPFSTQQTLRIATQQYKQQVILYKSTNDKTDKKHIRENIAGIKETFSQVRNPDDEDYRKWKDAEAKSTQHFYSMSFDDRDEWNKKLDQLRAEADVLGEKYEQKLKTLYSNSFEWSFEFPEVLDDYGNFVGFDVIIGNPPYIRLEHIREMSKSLEIQNYTTFKKQGDLYCLFIERSFQLLKHDGISSIIIPNKWIRAGYGKPVRELFLSKKMNILVDIGNAKVFDEAGITVCIIIARNENNLGTRASRPQTLEKCGQDARVPGKAGGFVISNANDSARPFNISALPTDWNNDFYSIVKQTEEVFDLNLFSGDAWVISSQKDKNLFEKLQNECQSLEEFLGRDAYYGVKTGLTKAFIIDENTKNQLIQQDKKSAELIKPALRGRDIKPYVARNTNVYLITTFPSLKIDIDNYPAIKQYFLNIGYDRLKQTGEKSSRKKSNNKWFETQDTIAYYEKFAYSKIMYQTFQRKPCFIFDEKGLFCNNSMWFIPTENKSLLAILNSKTGWWLITKCCSNLEGMYQLIWNYFRKFPIPRLSSDQQLPLIDLINKILSAKKENPTADTAAQEMEIDKLVYQLYGLTEDEISIIEKPSAAVES